MNKLASGAAALLLAACATVVPTSPGVLVLPGTGKNFDQFRADDHECRMYAHAQVGGKSAEQAAVDSGVRSAAIGTAIGTVAGAAIGGHQGAVVGGGLGLATGAIHGSGSAHAAGYTLQQRYDFAFTQCMYAKGHKVPVAGRYSDSSRVAPQGARLPPPPPGQPPAEAPPDYRSN